MKRHSLILWLAAACLAAWPAAAARADGPSPGEYQVKAAFIYNFVQFVDWPADAFADGKPDQDAKAPLVVATVGPDPFRGALERAMDGKSAGGRRLVVRHFDRADDVRGCHVLFVGAAAAAQMPAILQSVHGGGVLLVGEADRFLDDGGTIRFFTEDNRLRFEVDPGAAERARLRISSRLLKLARIHKG